MSAIAACAGLIAVVFFIVTIFIYVLIVPGAGPKGEVADRTELVAATLNILPVGVVFVVVIGGLYFRFFNPTPAASVSVVMVTPFFWPVLFELNGGDFASADGSPFGMNTEDLKVWFGILALMVVELDLITPPVGMNVFIISAQARDVPMIETFIGVMPFFGAELVRVAILIAFPVDPLWLPAFFQVSASRFSEKVGHLLSSAGARDGGPDTMELVSTNMLSQNDKKIPPIFKV